MATCIIVFIRSGTGAVQAFIAGWLRIQKVSVGVVVVPALAWELPAELSVVLFVVLFAVLLL